MPLKSDLREDICALALSLYSRGLTHGNTGNISARQADGTLLITPTGTSFGSLDPAQLSVIDSQGQHLSGPKPTKEVALHTAFYNTRGDRAGAVVHLHSCHSTAWSIMPDLDPNDALPRLSAYGIMKLGKVSLLPFFMPGDPAMGDAITGLAGKRSAVLLAHHGPVVSAKDLEAAGYAAEEMEATAKLALLTRNMHPKLMTDAQTDALVTNFALEWD